MQKHFFLGQKWQKRCEKYAVNSKQSLDFSDFWYETSLIYYFEYGIDSCARKKIWGRKWQKRCEKYALSSIFGNHSLDFSDFWYETSLRYYFKYCRGNYRENKFLTQKKKCEESHLISMIAWGHVAARM